MTVTIMEPKHISAAYPDAQKEIANIVEQWEQGLISEGEVLTKLIVIQSHLMDGIAKVTMQINKREREEAEERLKESGLQS